MIVALTETKKLWNVLSVKEIALNVLLNLVRNVLIGLICSKDNVFGTALITLLFMLFRSELLEIIVLLVTMLVSIAILGEVIIAINVLMDTIEFKVPLVVFKPVLMAIMEFLMEILIISVFNVTPNALLVKEIEINVHLVKMACT